VRAVRLPAQRLHRAAHAQLHGNVYVKSQISVFSFSFVISQLIWYNYKSLF
jgi:hypothetical protein